tara:strand:- start:1899 stop:2531 length:633 start_codon:yes stop_codon:yes gene_type:complete
MKSIIIFGKGPSVSKCTREIVEKYDDIAIINYPVLNTFFSSLISDKKIKYHFANLGTYDERYTDEVNNKLKIESIVNTNKKNSNNYKNYIKNKDLFKDSIREKYETYFKNNFDLDPNSGIMALQFLIDTGKYNNILLVGFDNYMIGEQTYYYPVVNFNSKIKYLIDKNIITKDGNFNIVSGHDPKKTEIYLSSLKNKYPNIKIERLVNNF